MPRRSKRSTQKTDTKVKPSMSDDLSPPELIRQGKYEPGELKSQDKYVDDEKKRKRATKTPKKGKKAKKEKKKKNVVVEMDMPSCDKGCVGDCTCMASGTVCDKGCVGNCKCMDMADAGGMDMTAASPSCDKG